ncbi:MAG TPA: efflux RND transporter permease subunit [Candidatus Hydrogenedentes bacterium]|nr:efflux RND transporter permease subunit [Candidatus Hydrogenedentota bacterium]HOL75635.1 efflux RND transporter permease subunit [Candidatus Hydrogenedentota bacterium]HPO84372.1 efflux RND transporter permease subunit [Candidatus Hydrogenedentota bacterium]
MGTDPQDNTPRRGAVAWMAGHPVAANLLMLTFLAGGLITALNMKQEVFPDIVPDTVTVTVAYPGASPEEVESSILLAIEEAVQNVDGVHEVTSMAREGGGAVTVEALVGVDIQQLGQDVKSEVDRIVTFPEDAEEPQVRIDTRRREVLTAVIYGDLPDTSLHQLAEQLRDWLIQSPDITQVDVEGLPPLEISIEVPENALRQYNLTLGEIASRLAVASQDIPSGGVKTESGEVLVRSKERRDYGEQFAKLPILNTPKGTQQLLNDIASINDSFAETDRYSLYNGKPAVLLDVFRVGKETPIQVSRAARKILEEFQTTLPSGVSVSVYNDQSDIYKQRLTLLLKNGAEGLLLVLIILGLFLEARLAFWVMTSIPIAFLGSFLLLPATDVTINMVSLFAYILALGMVVDVGIVVGENVYHYHQKGMKLLEAARYASEEVSTAVTYSILTNIASFVPIYFIPGFLGKIFRMIPVVITVVFLISLVQCLYILPAQLGHAKERRRQGINRWLHEKQQWFSRKFMHWVRDIYGPFLWMVIRHRYLCIALALASLALSVSYAMSGRMGFQQFPIVESDFADARVELPYGAPVQQTRAIVDKIQEAALRVVEQSGHPELCQGIIADIGQGGSHAGRVRVQLPEPEIRKKIMGTEEFVQRWRAETGEVPGVKSLRFSSESGGPGGGARPITVELSHRDMSMLEKAGPELAAILASYPGVSDVDDGFRPGKPQINFMLKPEGRSLGLTPREVARQLRHAFYGAEVLRQQRGRNEIKVMVRLPKAERSSEHTIENLLIRTPSGAFVPFREIAMFQRDRAYTTIERRNGRRVIQVTADITPRRKLNEVLADLSDNVLPQFVKNHPGLSYSFEGQQAQIRDSMASLKVTFLLALLAIYALLAIPFRSYTQPLVVMLSIPFGIVGALLGHLLMGYDLSIPSIFGIVALAGVVVNASLVMIDFANRLQEERKINHREAIHEAAIQRFRPIMLTTLTTFGGLAPMIFETSRQAKFLIPMALSLGYGILIATLISLVIVPAVYVIIEDLAHARLTRSEENQEAAVATPYESPSS